MQYFEDIEVGHTARFGAYEVTRDEVVAFAGKFDPQPFHLSDEAAAETHFGRLSASGWHTCAMTMAMVVENLKANRQRSEEHTSELQSLMRISYAVFCLKKTHHTSSTT